MNANFLNITKHFFYGENEEFQALRLPYKGNDFAMTILLPKKSLAALKEDSLASLRAGMKRVEVRVSLPKFRLEYSAQLREALTALGIRLAFTSKADFSGMRDPEPGNPYSLSLVAHKAFVEVDEKGTEAAAATAVLTLKGSAATQEPKIFRADKPFAFFIEHLPTDTVLFMGRLAKP